MDISSYKVAVILGTGTLGAIIVDLFGGWDSDIITLCIFMAVDYIFGLAVAGIFKKSNKTETGGLSSNAAFKGFCKKGVILLLVLVTHRLDILMKTDFIRSGAIIGFCANELLSIIESVALMGVPLPKVITSALDILRKQSDEDDKDNKDEK